MPTPMSKLARLMVLVAMLAAMQLAGLVAVAQAHTGNDPASARHAALGRLGFLATVGHAVASQEQPTADAQRLFRRGERASQAQPTADAQRLFRRGERASQAQPTADATNQRGLLAQERYYSTWDYGDTVAAVSDEPSGQPGWVTPALGVLAAVLAVVAGVAVLVARRAHRGQRAEQTA
jgi:hypothetical protein